MDEKQFENNVRKHIDRFVNPKKATKKLAASFDGTKLKVTLKVRKKQLAADVFYSKVVDTLSELQAEIEARKAARADGYSIIAYVQDIEKV